MSVRLVCLSLLLALSLLGHIEPQKQEAKANPSGQWYLIQMSTRTGYSSYMQVPSPASLYNTVKAWKEAGFSAVIVNDYLLPEEDVPSHYTVNPNFDPGNGWYNYSVTGAPRESVANFSVSYPSSGGGAGSGRLYVNGTGKAMVSYYHSTYTAQSGRHTLDLYRTQVLEQWLGLTASFSGNVALGVEIRFTSGRSYIVYRRAGTGDYTNTTNTKYVKTLIDWANRQPFTHTGVWLGYYEEASTVYDNHNFNITGTYINLWGLDNYLNDKLLDFRWFTESFDSSSWVDAYFDNVYWVGYRSWARYIKDIQFAESSHGIPVIPGYDITTGLPHGQENEAIAINVNGTIMYNGTVPSYLTTPQQVAEKGGLIFFDELFFYPNGTAYPSVESVSLVDWLGRGFAGSYILPMNLVNGWDPALKIIFDEERNERMWLVHGAHIHGNYTQRALRSKYSMVYVEGTITKQKIVDAISAGHIQAVYTNQNTNEVVRTNLTIQDFSIGSWIMGDWATPSSSPVLNIDVRSDVPISNVTLHWNGKILRSWLPFTKTFTQSLNVAMSGVFRLVAYDYGNNYETIGNPIFLKPTIPYVKETTHPRDLTVKFFDNKLVFTVYAPSETTSATQVDCGDWGEPTAVYTSNGILSWNYNTSTRLLSLNVTHNDSAEIVVDWRTPGDVNGDGKVNSTDLIALSQAYGSTQTLPNWNPNCDFNRDNIISVLDLHPLGKNYGKTKP